MIEQKQLGSYKWSSYPGYVRPKLRSAWLRVDRLLGEHGVQKDTATGRRRFERAMLVLTLGDEESSELRRGWQVGAEDFRDRLAEKLSRYGRKEERARERRETDEALAERVVLGALAKVRWKQIDLRREAKGHRAKVKIARQLREQTPMSRHWIAQRLHMGTPSYVSNLLGSVDSKI